ncbi:MAG: DUF4038 domain-containing protein [Acidobacteria bacterium]|nr:MAG: DUF4038 domain-containing protein [Acidobacteriota bacterium]
MKFKHFWNLALVILFLGNVQLWATVNGPVNVSHNGRHFVDRSGTPFFWLGDTAWPLFVQYSQAQAEAYLKNRSAKGFSVIQGVLAWGAGSGMESSVPLPNCKGERPWLDNDPSKPNEAYFKYVDYLVDFANRHDLVLAVMPTWGYYVVDTRIINLQNARAYGRWLGDRYRNSPNIIWVSGGDRIPLGYEDVYRELARGLREGDGGSHLITYHPSGWRSSSEYFHEEKWLDYNSIQTWTDWPQIHGAVVSDGLLTPPKPVVLAEPAYENGPEYPRGPITPLIVRRQAWWTVMGGGSFTYGQNQMWRMETGWDSTFDTPGAEQVCMMRKILGRLNWWEMVPDQGLFLSGVSSERTLNTALRARKGDRALIYLSSQCHVFVNLEKLRVKQVKAFWINPITGEQKEAGTYSTGNYNGRPFPDRAVAHFATPGHWEDALLLLEEF